MSTTFPINPDTYTTKVDGVDTVMAAHINDLQDATTAIEQALLGVIPDGNVQYVKKAASSTDNAVPRFDGTDGKKIQNSGVIINDNGQLSGNGLDGWIYDTDTWSYVSTTSFKVSGKDVRYRFPKGTKIKLVQSGSTKYFYVIATAYSTDTTITITGGSDYSLVSGTISGQAYSYAAAPQGFPAYFNWTPTFTGFSKNPTGYHRFKIIDNICFLFVKEDTGTSNSGGFTLTAPVTPIIFEYCIARICDNGIIPTAPGLIEFYDLTMHIYRTLEGLYFTNSGTKWAQFAIQYLI